MHSVSDFIFYGAIEILVILLLVVILLVTYNVHLRGRIKTLDGWLTQLKNKTVKLIEEVKADGDKTKPTLLIVQNVWPAFSQAALGLLTGDAKMHRASFIKMLEELNQCLDYPDLQIAPGLLDDGASSGAPDAKPSAVGGIELGNLKASANEQKSLITMLLRQQTDADSAIIIKVSELENLQRFHRESEVCVRLLEDELETAHQAIAARQTQVAEAAEINALIRRFTQESSEMLTYIDSLEKEIAGLQSQLSQ